MKSTKGFTLVELAIVITIIGLLIGGVLKGQELLDNARMTSLGNQIKGYQAAVTTFRDVYKAYPGDLAGATNFIEGCTAANNCANGDGNGVIGAATSWRSGYDTVESFQAWKHMALAKLITGVDTTVIRTATNYTGGKEVPTSPFGGQVYIQTVNGTQVSAQTAGSGIVSMVSKSKSGAEQVGTPGNGLFTSSTAQKIDLKFDDGKAFSGDVFAVGPAWTSGCGEMSISTTGYDPNASGTLCDIGFNVGK